MNRLFGIGEKPPQSIEMQEFPATFTEMEEEGGTLSRQASAGSVVSSLEDTVPLVSKKGGSSSWCGRVFEHLFQTVWQFPPIICAGVSTVESVASAVAGAVLIVFAANSTGTTEQVVGYVIGGLLLLNGGVRFLNCGVHLLDCICIAEYVPYEALATNEARLHAQNKELKEEVERLSTQVDRTKRQVKLLGGFVDYNEKQIDILQGDLTEKNQELDLIGDKLGKTTDKLDKAADEIAKKDGMIEKMEQSMKDMSSVLKKFASENKEVRNQLDELGIVTDGLENQGEEWSEGIDDFDEGNDRYEKLNNQQKQMLDYLEQELARTVKAREALSVGLAELGKNTQIFGSDVDKLVETAERLNKQRNEKAPKLLDEKRRENQRLLEAVRMQQQALGKLKKDLLQLINNGVDEEKVRELIDAIDAISEKTEQSIDQEEESADELIEHHV